MHEIHQLRRQILIRASGAGEGHIPSALSILDILWVLYMDILRERQSNGIREDRVIVSKGHGSLALYEVLCAQGFFDAALLETFCQFDSLFGGHPDRTKVPGVEASTGSLGHGLPLGVGLALSLRMKSSQGRVFVLVGDGEANEGTTWESALLAAHHRVANITCIVDYNHSTDRALAIGSIADKFSAFGWKVEEVDGHDHGQLRAALSVRCELPTLVVAHTVKGKGIPEMEDNPAWHHGAPSPAQLVDLLGSMH